MPEDQRLRDLLDLTQSALGRFELSIVHLRTHCAHGPEAGEACAACEADADVTHAAGSLRRGLLELFAAADYALGAASRQHRAATRSPAEPCTECDAIAAEAIERRDELLEAVGTVLTSALVAELRRGAD